MGAIGKLMDLVFGRKGQYALISPPSHLETRELRDGQWVTERHEMPYRTFIRFEARGMCGAERAARRIRRELHPLADDWSVVPMEDLD